MAATTFVIEKKKYRIIPEEEYLQLKEDIHDLLIFLNRQDEKGIDADKFFATLKLNKKKK